MGGEGAQAVPANLILSILLPDLPAVGQRFDIDLRDDEEGEDDAVGKKRLVEPQQDAGWGEEEGWGVQKNGIFVWNVTCTPWGN